MSEHSLYGNILSNVVQRLNTSHTLHILSNNEYKQHMSSIQTTMNRMSTIPLEELKTTIKSYIRTLGSVSISDIRSIMCEDATRETNHPELWDYIQQYFQVIGVDVYESKPDTNGITFYRVDTAVSTSTTPSNVSTTNKRKRRPSTTITPTITPSATPSSSPSLSPNSPPLLPTMSTIAPPLLPTTASLTLTSSQLEGPSFIKWINVQTKPVILRLMGAKLIVPFQSKYVLLLSGYFSNDDFQQYLRLDQYHTKLKQLRDIFQHVDIPEYYSNEYIQCMSNRDFITMTNNQLMNDCLVLHSELLKAKTKPLSKLTKDFVTSDMEKQRTMLMMFLYDHFHPESLYLANALYDLLKPDSILAGGSNYQSILYHTFHWSIKTLLNKMETVSLAMQTRLLSFTEDSIPYDKRIALLKCNDYVKSKAMDKWKELNNAKGGESTSKVQQYLDGLLKIPFGTYKRESIRCLLDTTKGTIHTTIRELCTMINHSGNLSPDILIPLSKIENDLAIRPFNSMYMSILLRELTSWKQQWETQVNISLSFLETVPMKQWTTKLLHDVYSILGQTYPHKKVKKDHIGWLQTQSCSLSQLRKLVSVVSCSLPDILAVSNRVLQTIDSVQTTIHTYFEEQKKYMESVRTCLDTAVYGMEDAKRQIQRLIGQWITGEDRGYVFGLEGPPGTGKTTLAKQGIARCLRDESGDARPFVFITMGGSSNGSTLEGHNYTYVGSTWGRIVDGLMETQCMNPIIYIDELDKISKTEHGREIIGILTHLTDPSQNSEFMDKYFGGIKLDLSKCLIIFSYNDVSMLDRVLLDRIQRIRIDPMTKPEKLIVAQSHIIPDIVKTVGIHSDDISIDNATIEYIMDTWTHEPGVRKLKERLYDLYREANLMGLSSQLSYPFNIRREWVDQVMVHYTKKRPQEIHNIPCVGRINGLFATTLGYGGIIPIETSFFPSSSHLELKLTGQQGDVMKESMNVAKTLALSMLSDALKKRIVYDPVEKKETFGIHIHCPEGATPKDGPSAGTAITIALLSLFANIPIREDIALTGEITLGGRVSAIGGLDMKIEGGKQAGVKKILYPFENEDDLRIVKHKKPYVVEDIELQSVQLIQDAIRECMQFPGDTTASDYFV